MTFNFSRRVILLTVSSIILFTTYCEKPVEPDTTPPTVSITSPTDGSTVSEVVPITCISTDNEGVEKVELWVDGVSTGQTDNNEPYAFQWNTTSYGNNTTHTITVRSYDLSGNKTDSDPITLIVDNRISVPTSVSITSISFQNGGFHIEWSKSKDNDFKSYNLEYSFESTMGNKEVIYTTEDKVDTTYFMENVNPIIYYYFTVIVTDTFNYTATSQVVSSSLDSPPTIPILNVKWETLSSFEITWSPSPDNDFSSYELYESFTDDMSGMSLLYQSGVRTETNYTVTGVVEDERRYYQVVVIDVFGLESVSSITEGSSYRTITFTTSREGNGEIYIMDIDGSNQINLTQNNESDYDPQFSPDGEKIVFISYRDENEEIYIMNVDGSNQTRLTNDSGEDYLAQFSPDGTKILFFSRRNDEKDVYLMNIDGSDETNLSLSGGSMDIPRDFSPDGTTIVFESTRDGNREVYIMNIDGSNQINLTNNGATDTDPQFSPDGSKIAFTSDRDGNYEVYIMNVDGSNQTRLTNNSGGDSRPRFSPDGSMIAFRSDRDGNLEVYIMNVDGSDQINLSNSSIETDYGHQFTPDGSRIVFVSARDGNNEIYVMNIDGSNQINLTNNSATDSEPMILPFPPY